MKRIITCSDGTWNKPGSMDRGTVVQTNVEKVYRNISDQGVDEKTGLSIKQLKVYDQGVGTGYSELDKILGGVSGAGIDQNIMDMYSFICLNYDPGDDIFLFGFSRGAYTARSVAGFIRNCGLLNPSNIQLLNKAFDLYRNRNDYAEPESDLMQSWRKAYCIEDCTPIMFIGVWDTVGALGIPLRFFRKRNLEKYKFHDLKLSSTVKHAYQALAIDEKRILFEPTIWEKSDSVEQGLVEQKMEQRWFAGVHCNVGGGYSDSGLSDVALHWLVRKAEQVGLCFYKPPPVCLNPDCCGEIRNSFTPKYWFSLPRDRKICIENPSQNQVVDDSVWQRRITHPSYRPENVCQRRLQGYVKRLITYLKLIGSF